MRLGAEEPRGFWGGFRDDVIRKGRTRHQVLESKREKIKPIKNGWKGGFQEMKGGFREMVQDSRK